MSFFLIILIFCFTKIILPSDYERCENLASKLDVDVGIVVTAYNRPHYLRKVIKALEKNKESQELPFIFILDGGPQATQKENIAIITNAKIKYKFVICHDVNQGCGRTLIGARRLMFEWCKFKKGIFFEDDLVVSPQYIRLLLNLYDFTKKNYDNVGVVQCYNKCFLPEKNKKKYANHIIEPFGGFWGYCMDRDAYNAVAALMDEHEKKHLITITKDKANSLAIANWLEHTFINCFSQDVKNSDRVYNTTINWEYFYIHFISQLKKYYKKRRDGQDFEFRLALQKVGMVRITTVVSRAQYIGEKGAHHNNYFHLQYGYKQLRLFKSKYDECRENFICDKINANNIIVDLTVYNSKGADRKLRKLIDYLVENGYNLICEGENPCAKHLFSHYVLPYSTKEFSQKEFIRLVPIRNLSDIEYLKIKLKNNENNELYAYLLDKKMIFTNRDESFFEEVINSGVRFIAADEEIKASFAEVYEGVNVMMWYEVIMKLFKIHKRHFTNKVIQKEKSKTKVY